MAWLFLGFAAAGVLGVVLGYRERLIIRRLRGLVDTTRRWAAGDFSVRSPLAFHGGELGRLGLALNHMVESLERQLLKRTEAERRERQRVVELDRAYHELQQAQAQLIRSERLGAIGQMASGIVHEVKNPLGIVLACAELLEQKLTPSHLPSETMEILGTIEEAVTRADRVIQGLLRLARPASLQLTPGNFHEAVAAALVLLEPQLAHQRITVVKELMDNPPPVLLDSNHMQQVLINLFTNAQHAMPQGGRLTIRTAVQRLEMLQPGVGRRATDRFKLGAEVFVCAVQDTGIGIPKDQLDKVFEPFFTTKPAGEGTGLGLAIVQAIIVHHGGVVTVDSVAGQGTTMTITLPLAPPPS